MKMFSHPFVHTSSGLSCVLFGNSLFASFALNLIYHSSRSTVYVDIPIAGRAISSPTVFPSKWIASLQCVLYRSIHLFNYLHLHFILPARILDSVLHFAVWRHIHEHDTIEFCLVVSVVPLLGLAASSSCDRCFPWCIVYFERSRHDFIPVLLGVPGILHTIDKVL